MSSCFLFRVSLYQIFTFIFSQVLRLVLICLGTCCKPIVKDVLLMQFFFPLTLKPLHNNAATIMDMFCTCCRDSEHFISKMKPCPAQSISKIRTTAYVYGIAFTYIAKTTAFTIHSIKTSLPLKCGVQK